MYVAICAPMYIRFILRTRYKKLILERESDGVHYPPRRFIAELTCGNNNRDRNPKLQVYDALIKCNALGISLFTGTSSCQRVLFRDNK